MNFNPKLTSKDDDFAVLDNLLDEDTYNKFCSFYNDLDFAYRSLTGWQKVWRVSDGLILSGPPYYAFKSPHNSMMDIIGTLIDKLVDQHFDYIVGKRNVDWDDYFMTPYIYPTGTKISWHNDHGYSGAAIFYTHRFWDPNWGGELFIAKTSKDSHYYSPDSIDRTSLIPLLNNYGMGSYISPLPNRMVFTKGSTWHSINRVDPVAGDALRCSIVTFFYKRKKNATS